MPSFEPGMNLPAAGHSCWPDAVIAAIRRIPDNHRIDIVLRTGASSDSDALNSLFGRIPAREWTATTEYFDVSQEEFWQVLNDFSGHKRLSATKFGLFLFRQPDLEKVRAGNRVVELPSSLPFCSIVTDTASLTVEWPHRRELILSFDSSLQLRSAPREYRGWLADGLGPGELAGIAHDNLIRVAWIDSVLFPYLAMFRSHVASGEKRTYLVHQLTQDLILQEKPVPAVAVSWLHGHWGYASRLQTLLGIVPPRAPQSIGEESVSTNFPGVVWKVCTWYKNEFQGNRSHLVVCADIENGL